MIEIIKNRLIAIVLSYNHIGILYIEIIPYTTICRIHGHIKNMTNNGYESREQNKYREHTDRVERAFIFTVDEHKGVEKKANPYKELRTCIENIEQVYISCQRNALYPYPGVKSMVPCDQSLKICDKRNNVVYDHNRSESACLL